jgi:hypothetical protein
MFLCGDFEAIETKHCFNGFSIEIIIACLAFLSTHGLHVTPTPLLPPSPKNLVLGGY